MNKHTILLVDDEENVLSALRREMKRESYDVIACNNAVDAGDLIEERKGKIDVIISDNKMPRVKGVDFLAALRKEYPDIIRIMLTGHSDLEDAKRAINEGEVYKFLTKPWDSFELKMIVRDALIHRDLWEKNRQLFDKIKNQEATLIELEKKHPGITKVERDEAGNIIVEEKYFYESLDEYMKRYL